MEKYILKLFLVIILGFCKTTYAQNIEFNRVIPDDGTNLGFVIDITQDKNGFMWFATENGLYKYDGDLLTPFKNDPAISNSIASNRINTIHTDSNGILWIGSSNGGLNRYNPETGIFTHFVNDPNDSTSIVSNRITKILRDSKGILWIGTHQGLDQFDPKTNGFIHFKPEKNDATSLSDYRVRTLYEDKQGTLWIGTGNPFQGTDRNDPEYGGLNRYNRDSGTFTQYMAKADDPFSLSSNKIFSIFEDNKGVFWIGTYNNGLFQMDREKGTFKQTIYDPTHPKTFGNPISAHNNSYNRILCITQDTTGGYWIAKRYSGLYNFNPSVGKMHHFQGIGMEIYGFIDQTATVTYTSRDGVLWIGGINGNIYRVNVLHQKISKPFVSTSKVNTLYEEQDGTFWIGTENELMRVDKTNGDTLKFNKDSFNKIFNIKKDLQGTLWVATYNGLFKWDSVKKNFIGYRHDPKNENSLSDNRVTGCYEDSQHNFWVGTFSGLLMMDRNTGQFSHFSGLQDAIITSILEDKSGTVWIGSWSGRGIKRFNPETKSFKTYLDRENISIIYEDSDGVLWACSQKNGLMVFDSDVDDFVPFGDSFALNRLSHAHHIVEDNLKNLWLKTTGGIVRLNQQRNQTRFFGINYGVERSLVSFSAALKGVNGDIYFGSKTGYYQINPSDFTNNNESAEIFFTRFLLFDQEIKRSENGLLKQSLQEAKTISLPYNQNVFSFDFTLIDYVQPEEVRLQYYLENYDNDWMPSYNKRRASYFNIPPGNYVFRVKGTNSEGVWSEKKIEVIILPPWYRTWLAYVIYALIFITGSFAFHNIQRKRILRKERQKTQERELAQAKEIEKAYTELKSTQAQLIQSEKMASLGELTAGIAHEIQNPLNFVNNFSEVSNELIDEMNEEIEKGDLEETKAIAADIKLNLEKINHHGKRADAIVKGMLQHSRSSGTTKEPTDINKLADEYLRLAYHGLRAKDKTFNATLITDFDESIASINVLPQDIGRVILNLITNAFYVVNEKKKQHPTGYDPTVTVITKKAGEKVTILVKDNGNGIPKHIIDKIFQPFFTTKPTGEGTGLGLSLSYDIVKAHGGELRVETKEQVGTTFTIILPNA